MKELVVTTLLLISNANAFSVPSIQMTSRRSSNPSAAVHNNKMSLSSSPSDSAQSEPDFSEFGYGAAGVVADVTVNDETTPSEELVNQVLDTLPTNFGEVSSETQSSVNELLYKLEPLNPSEDPATSPMINGVWELRYAGGYTDDFALSSPTRQLALFLYSGGYSPGLFCYKLAQGLPKAVFDSSSPLVITIGRNQPRIQASLAVNMFNGAVDSTVDVKARLEAESGIRLRETYESVTVMGRDQSIPAPLQYSRDLYITYVDEDLLIVRDASGVPEVLVRQEKKFQRNWGTEPGSLTDLEPPGDGKDAAF